MMSVLDIWIFWSEGRPRVCPGDCGQLHANPNKAFDWEPSGGTGPVTGGDQKPTLGVTSDHKAPSEGWYERLLGHLCALIRHYSRQLTEKWLLSKIFLSIKNSPTVSAEEYVNVMSCGKLKMSAQGWGRHWGCVWPRWLWDGPCGEIHAIPSKHWCSCEQKRFRPSHIYGATRSIVVEGEEAGPVQDTRPSCLLTGPKQPCMVTLISCVSRVLEIVS